MSAGVGRWEGADGDTMRRSAEEINSRADSGPPEGVPSKGIMILIDPDNGRGMAGGPFQAEEDYRQGDETLNQMNPPGEGFGRRTAVEKYEVAVDLRAQ